MPYWVVQARGAFTVHEGATWLDVLSEALEELGLDLPRVRVAGGSQACLRVADPTGNIIALIRQGLDGQGAADGVLDRLPPLEGGLVAAFDAPLPAVESTLPSEVAERLFELTTPLDEASTDAQAAGLALDLLLRIAPAEAGSVILAGLEQARFEFLAAVGPAANDVLPLTLPFGQGHLRARARGRRARQRRRSAPARRRPLCAPLARRRRGDGLHATVPHRRAPALLRWPLLGCPRAPLHRRPLPRLACDRCRHRRREPGGGLPRLTGRPDRPQQAWGRRGSRKVKVGLSPRPLSKVMSPPRRWLKRRVMASPSPVPPCGTWGSAPP